MTLNKPKLESILVVVFILLLFVLLFGTENSRRNERQRFEQERALDKKYKEFLQHKNDSLDFLSRTLAKHYSDVYKMYISSEKSLEKVKKENDALRKSPPIPYTDQQIDSVLTKWYGPKKSQ